MDMARIDYSNKIKGDNVAKAKANELNVSPKHSIEIAGFIRNKRVNDAIAYLNEVVELKKAVPFRHFNRNVAHKRGLPGNWDAGRYRSRHPRNTSGSLNRSRRMPNISVSMRKTSRSSTHPPTAGAPRRHSSPVQWDGQPPKSVSP